MRKCTFLVMMAGIMIMTSCSSKKVVLLEDMQPGLDYPMGDKTEMIIQNNDRLSIYVSSKNPELTIPFNQEMEAMSTVNTGDATTSAGNRRGREYLVDLRGNIEFPILGTLHVEGFTCVELGQRIKEQLQERSLLDDAVVMVEMLNWRVPVLGEVQNTKVIEVPEGRHITLLEALTQAGGLTEYAAPDKVVVIREEGGVRKKVVNDLQSTDLFKSPTFYLQQNDVVYVEPREMRRTAKEERQWRWYSLGTGLIGLAISIITLTKVY